MGSHHFIGTGLVTAELEESARDTQGPFAAIADRLRAAGLKVVSHHLAAFENGGLTAVWILAESHLVLHHWASEGFATLDLHVCDYTSSNAEKAARLRKNLTAFCFAPGTETWRELHLEQPQPAVSATA